MARRDGDRPPRAGRDAIGLAVALAAAAALAASCADAPAPEAAPSASSAAGAATAAAPAASAPAAETAGTALAALATLPVRGRAARTGYARDRFGPAWADVDGNGCDTRSDILRRDLAERVGDACTTRRGRLDDPYTGRAIVYVAGGDAVEVDHVVALGDAWQKGAQRLPYATRVALANDPLELLAVDAAANRQKGDGDAATWLPPRRAFRCAYAARQIAVKARYGQLWVTAAERDALSRVLAACPDEPLPGAGAPPAAGGEGARRFARCADVRAAGLAPLRRGTALYAANRELDGDGDGVACEDG